MARTMVIAEPGCTHEGSLDRMLALVELAASAGADAIKFQWTSDAAKMARRREARDYEPYYKWLQFKAGWHELLSERCRKLGFSYGCTVYLPEDAAKIDPWIDFYKVSSFEAEDGELLAAYRTLMDRNEKRLFVSLGLDAKPESVKKLLGDDVFGSRVTLLHCVSAYPAPFNELNLSKIHSLGLEGISDHAEPMLTHVGALAVAAGAKVIEKHVKLEDCKPSNPDYAVSMGAHQFKAYIGWIREAEQAVGHPNAGSPSQESFRRYRVTKEKR